MRSSRSKFSNLQKFKFRTKWPPKCHLKRRTRNRKIWVYHRLQCLSIFELELLSQTVGKLRRKQDSLRKLSQSICKVRMTIRRSTSRQTDLIGKMSLPKEFQTSKVVLLEIPHHNKNRPSNSWTLLDKTANETRLHHNRIQINWWPKSHQLFRFSRLKRENRRKIRRSTTESVGCKLGAKATQGRPLLTTPDPKQL